MPREFSIPLNDEARVEANNEVDLRPKGVLVESFVRRGLASFGGHVFYDESDRYLAHAVATGNSDALHAELDGRSGRSRTFSCRAMLAQASAS